MNRKHLLPILAVGILIVAWMAIFGVHMLASQHDVSIVAAGDVMIGRDMHKVLSLGTSPYRNVSNVTSNADMLLINFDNAATSNNTPLKKESPLKCNPGYIFVARGNNNTVAALANNHVCDYGIGGLKDTISALDKANITHLGAGLSELEAHTAVTQEINGRSITVLNYVGPDNFKQNINGEIPYANGSSGGYSAYDSEEAKNQIMQAKDNGDFVIVYMNFGNEYSTEPNDEQVRIAHELIDDGADVVLGAHPHVAQGIEKYRGKPIFYSMGNFLYDLDINETWDAYMVGIDLLEDKGVCTVYPVHLANYLPQFMNETNATAFLNNLTPKSDELEIDGGVAKLEFSLN